MAPARDIFLDRSLKEKESSFGEKPEGVFL